MNCINHPDLPVSAYCQSCGKPLCKDCVRNVGGVIYCEQCVLARMGATAAPGFSPDVAATLSGLVPPSHAANPALAGLLGVIPGVGAMYNGQFVKGLAHVLIFAVLVSLSHSAGIFGIFIAAWVIYQIFDAYHTAKARRDGLPLPDPFGLNDLGSRLGFQQAAGGVPPRPGTYTSAYTAADPNAAAGAPAGGFVPPAQPPYGAAYSAAPGTPGYPAGYTPVPPPPGASFDPAVPPSRGSDVPTGAILLIGLGILFLLGTLGVFNGDLIERGWPVIIIAIGVWLFVRRSREVRQTAANSQGGVQ